MTPSNRSRIGVRLQFDNSKWNSKWGQTPIGPGSRRWSLTPFAAILVVVAIAGCAYVARSSGGEWVATWEAAPQLTEDRNMPPAPLDGATLRQLAHVTLGVSEL